MLHSPCEAPRAAGCVTRRCASLQGARRARTMLKTVAASPNTPVRASLFRLASGKCVFRISLLEVTSLRTHRRHFKAVVL